MVGSLIDSARSRAASVHGALKEISELPIATVLFGMATLFVVAGFLAGFVAWYQNRSEDQSQPGKKVLRIRAQTDATGDTDPEAGDEDFRGRAATDAGAYRSAALKGALANTRDSATRGRFSSSRSVTFKPPSAHSDTLSEETESRKDDRLRPQPKIGSESSAAVSEDWNIYGPEGPPRLPSAFKDPFAAGGSSY